MEKYNIFGNEVVKVSDLRHAIRRLRKGIETNYRNFDKEKQAMVHLAYNDIVRQIYLEELKAAESPDEIRAILEMPGDFMVVNRVGKHDMLFFAKREDDKPLITRYAPRGMHFDYESKAKEIAEWMNENVKTKTEWRAVDVSAEEYEDNKRLLSAIFGEDET